LEEVDECLGVGRSLASSIVGTGPGARCDREVDESGSNIIGVKIYEIMLIYFKTRIQMAGY
jgi:hypothetical protein